MQISHTLKKFSQIVEPILTASSFVFIFIIYLL